MGWRDRMQPASFKGAPFAVDGTSYEGGRRVNLKRLAGGGIIAVDLNLEPELLDVTAFVYGDDYDLARDRLERTLREGGTGPVVLPTRGTRTARVVRGPNTTEHKSEGGYAVVRFQLYLEAVEQTGLRASADTSAQVKTASQAVARAATADAARTVTNKGFTRTQLDRASSLVGAATRAVQRANRFSASVVAPVANVTRDLDAFDQAAITLMSTPAMFATTLLDLVFTAYQLPQTAVGGIERLAGLPGLLTTTAFARGRGARLVDRVATAFRGFGDPFDKAPAAAQQRRAEEVRSATARLVRAASVSAAAAAYADAEFDSATFAVAALERLVGDVDALQKLEPPDDVFAALDDLRAALAQHIYETASKLPETVIAEVRREVPALLLAYVLYGDALQEADIVARNRLPEPLFVRGKVEVLRP